MNLIHDDPEFEELLRVVAAARTISLAAVETDYWLTHELWSLQGGGLQVCLTGASSLSKGFGLIDRVSEDLEMRAQRGRWAGASLSVQRSPSSFVHDELAERGLLSSYDDNRPRDLACLHPLVILLEKLAELGRSVSDDSLAPVSFVHHFEDAVRIIRAHEALPALEHHGDVRALAAHLLRTDQLRRICRSDDRAFAPDASLRWREIRSAHRAIAPMFWAPRLKLVEACAEIRAWLAHTLDT